MSQQISNRQIVDELKAGDRSGCVHLMQAYQHRLFEHLVHTFHIPREDAEELVSDVLLTVVRRISLFSFRNSDEDFARWVFTVLRNHVRDFLKKQARQGVKMEAFSEEECGDGDGIFTAVREITQIVVRDFMENESGEDGGNGENEAGKTENRPLQLVVETLKSMETWERVLLRCRALDIPYEEIAP